MKCHRSSIKQVVLIVLILYSTCLISPIDAVGGVNLGTLGSVAVAGLAVVLYSTVFTYAPPYTPELHSLTGKTIVITGASSGLGLESAKKLSIGGANVVLTARSAAKGQKAVDTVKQYLVEKNLSTTYKNQKIIYKTLDLDDLKSVKYNVAHYWDDVQKIDVLMNNAGVMALPKRQLTVDGYEQQIQSNHLGHFVLTALLFPKLAKDARIINISSIAHIVAPFGIQFDNLWKAEKFYIPAYTYGQTKLANILFTQELQRRVNSVDKYSSISALHVHPGPVATDLIHKLALGEFIPGLDGAFAKALELASRFHIIKPVEMGAATQVWLSTIPTISADWKGKYFADCKETSVSVRTDPTAARRLWEERELMSGVRFNIVPVTK